MPGHAGGGAVTPGEDRALSDLRSDSGSSSSSSPSVFVAPMAASPSPSSTSMAQRNRQSLPRWMRRELYSPPGPVPPQDAAGPQRQGGDARPPCPSSKQGPCEAQQRPYTLVFTDRSLSHLYFVPRAALHPESCSKNHSHAPSRRPWGYILARMLEMCFSART